MKSFISKLSVLLFAAMFAVVGCQDYAEDIRQLNKQLNNDVSELHALINELKAEIAKLHAETEFEKYRIVQDKLFMSDYDRFLIELEGHIEG